MQRKWGIPFEQIIYVGDNLNKDFQACRQLGMRWKYFRNEDGLYFNDEYITKNMIEKLQDIRI